MATIPVVEVSDFTKITPDFEWYLELVIHYWKSFWAILGSSWRIGYFWTINECFQFKFLDQEVLNKFGKNTQ